MDVNTVTITINVDDLAATGSPDDRDKFTKLLSKSFAVKIDQVNTDAPSRFLGANITKLPQGGYTIDQMVYTPSYLTKPGSVARSQPRHHLTRATMSSKAQENERMLDDVQAKQHGHIEGQLLWLAQFTRPDISVAVFKLTQHLARPSVANWQSMRHVLRYLRGTSGYKLRCTPVTNDSVDHNVLIAYSDASFLSEKKSKSRSGSVIRLAGAAITWNTERQGPTALSTSESETIALCPTAQLVVPERRLYADIQRTNVEDMLPTVIYEDNQAVVFTANNDGFVRSGSRHMLVKYYYTRECIEEGLVTVMFMSGDVIPADMMTKILPRPRAHSLIPALFGMTHHEMQTPKVPVIAR